LSLSPLVSIITVVFNGEKHLQQTIDSVYNQTYKNIEYIIIDGNSTDRTLEIIKENEHKIHNWISENDDGLYDAMNKGIRMSRGELIGIINSDDWYERDAVQLVVDAYINNLDKKVFHGDRYDIDEKGDKSLYRFNSSRTKFLYFSMTYNHPSMFFHRSVYQEVLYNTNLRVYSDYELVLTVYLKNKKLFHYINKPYVNYRLDGLSSKQTIIKNVKEGTRARLNAGLKKHKILIFVLAKTSFLAFKKIVKSVM
tara:strand:+ start:49 stop:807 length:759 start_codon:yes stop_codon:yes gene_type:complete